MRFAILPLVIFVLISSSMANSGEKADPWLPLIKTMESEYPAGGPGAYAIVAQGGHILFSRGFGLADVEHNVLYTPDSVVRIASLTKQFTAVAVLELVQKGQLNLDDRLERILPDCPAAWRVITIGELLSQTSGLTNDLSPLIKQQTSDLNIDQILAVYKDLQLAWAPGTKWGYSNLNYWILGKVIETISGEPYAEFVSRHVLAKNMTRTRYDSHEAIIPGRAMGYEPGPNGGWINAPYFSPTLGYAAGGFLSTPTDMVLWYAALEQGAIIPPAVLTLALTERTTSDGKPTGYGLGWYVTKHEGLLTARHGGSTFGFQSSVYWIPSCSLVAAVFKNSNDKRGEPGADAQTLLNAAMERCPSSRHS